MCNSGQEAWVGCGERSEPHLSRRNPEAPRERCGSCLTTSYICRSRCNIGGKGRAQQGRKRVLRGGGWNNNGRNLRCANRNANQPDNRNDNIGLRLAGALRVGGSVSQRPVLFRRSASGGQSPGPRCVSRSTVNTARAENLPAGRLFSTVSA